MLRHVLHEQRGKGQLGSCYRARSSWEALWCQTSLEQAEVRKRRFPILIRSNERSRGTYRLNQWLTAQRSRLLASSHPLWRNRSSNVPKTRISQGKRAETPSWYFENLFDSMPGRVQACIDTKGGYFDAPKSKGTAHFLIFANSKISHIFGKCSRATRV